MGSSAEESDDILTIYQNLTEKTQTLLSELHEFRAFITSTVDARFDTFVNKFQGDVQREAKLLEKYSASLPTLSGCAKQNTTETSTSRWPVSTAVETGSQLHQIRSSNISHLDLIWQDVKRCDGVVGIRKQVRYVIGHHEASEASISGKHNSHARRESKEQSFNSADSWGGLPRTVIRGAAPFPRQGRENVGRQGKGHIVVDIICDHGAKWLKLFTKSQRWFELDLAKEGLVGIANESSDSSSGDDDSDEANTNGKSDTIHHIRDECNSKSHAGKHDVQVNTALEDLKLIRMAREFLAAAKTTRVNHRHPTVHFHLPKISRGIDKDIDFVLDYLSQIGISVLEASQHRTVEKKLQATHLESAPPAADGNDLSACFHRMLSPPPSLASTTDILNIDCTILIALISDISNFARAAITIPPHYNGRDAKKDIETQLASDESDPLLPNHIYPLLTGKKLVCTAKAATHLRNIVRVMGSQTETKRSNILLSYPNSDCKSSNSEVRKQLAALSSHPIPENVHLPIEVVQYDEENARNASVDTLDENVMQKIQRQPRLSPLNQSVFFYGWRRNLTTVSINRVVSEWLARAIDKSLAEIEWEEQCSGDIAVEKNFRGPQILICGRERSLLGNDKP